MCFRVFWSVQALYGAANALYWKCFKRQNSTHLKPLKHQNTKTSLYKLSKNNWVVTILGGFVSVRRKLQSTVSLDHPVLHILLNLKLLGSYLKIGRSKITSISAFRNKLFKLYRTTFWQAVWVNLCRKSIFLLADVQDWLHYGLRNRSWVSFPGCDHQTRPPLNHCQSQASSNLEPSSSSSPFFYWNRQKLHFP